MKMYGRQLLFDEQVAMITAKNKEVYEKNREDPRNRANGRQEMGIVAIEDSSHKALSSNDINEDIGLTRNLMLNQMMIPVSLALMATTQKDKLSDFKEFKGGYVAFGNDSKGGRISGKGTIKTSSIDFEKVSYVEELKFNLLSVSQICDKKHNVLFTDKECLILSPKFKFVDEDLVILRAPRKNDVYSLDLKNIIPSGGITCLVASGQHKVMLSMAIEDGGMSSTVEGVNNIRALARRIDRKISREPLELTPLDMFGPVSIESVNRKKYMLGGHDDCKKQLKSIKVKPSGVTMEQKSLAKLHNDAQRTAFEKEKKRIALEKGKECVDSTSTKGTQESLQALADESCDGKRVIGTKWVFRNKRDERGTIIKNKARLVAQGYRQEEGVDYDEVFAPVARIEAIRLFLAFASFMGFTVYQMDVKSAFLYGNITEEVYVKQPPGFEDPAHPNKVYRVVKALYGLHQAPRAWYERLSTFLLKHGYRRGAIDKTLFIKKDRRDIMLVQVYVDDIIFGSTKPSMVKDFEELMQKEFKMSSMGELTFFLGLQVKQTTAGIFLSQDKYVKDILNKFDFRTIKPASTPIEAHKSLGKDEEGEDVDVHLYRSMIGCLMYLTASRPDIMFAVCLCARFQVTPKVSHMHAVKRIFRYLKHQPKLGLWYPKDSPFHLEAFSDSDYAGDNHDRRSTSGGCQYLGRRLVSWQCKKQTIVAISSTEAEYVAAASCCAQVLWMQNQLLDYGFNFMNTEIHIDNESTICIVKNPVLHSKTKHIQIRHHFIRDCYEQRLINVVKVHTDDNVVDLLTKGFDLARFNFLVVTIGMMNP
ncbi:putative ribonuclease H-like domain-containing protein [Tanacetum coccineum]